MEITVKLHKVFPEQEFKNGFTKREFVCIDDSSSDYPQYISFQLLKDKCTLIDKYSEGDEIKVYFNLNGRSWTNPEGKEVYFNSLVAWKIEGDSFNQEEKEPKEEKAPPIDSDEDLLKNNKDLPF